MVSETRLTIGFSVAMERRKEFDRSCPVLICTFGLILAMKRSDADKVSAETSALTENKRFLAFWHFR